MPPGVAVVNNPPTNAGGAEDTSSITGSETSLEEENSNPLWYSCLGNLMDRGAWRTTVHGVAKSQTRLERQSTPVHTHTHTHTHTHCDKI